jgi:Fe(II)/alpha-ketoglutarate-dependent arginine beta-hydroxylase
MLNLHLTDPEIKSINHLLTTLKSEFSSAEDAAFINYASCFAHELPKRVRWLLNEFKLTESEAICCISGYAIDDHKIGQTPVHWKNRTATTSTIEEQMLVVLYGSLLGDVFGWSTQQNGYLVHDILPIKGHENEQLGTGSEQLLWWHTEDAFHPYRGDYIGLFCLRNPYKAVTTVADSSTLQLDPKHLNILFEPRFTIRPDESHLEKNKASIDFGLSAEECDALEDVLKKAYDKINQMNTSPEKIAILAGDSRRPYLRLDPYFMDPLTDDPEAQDALDALIRTIDANLQDIVLKPGDCCFIDNYRAVHGRKPFKAVYDGYDRWLKRVNITRDLRKSRDARVSTTSRIIF